MTTQHSPSDTVQVLRLSGDVDAVGAAVVREKFAQVADGRAIALDLSAVGFIDSVGLGALLGGVRRVREAGGDVVAYGVSPTTLRLFHTVGFDRVLAAAPGYEDAIARLR